MRLTAAVDRQVEMGDLMALLAGTVTLQSDAGLNLAAIGFGRSAIAAMLVPQDGPREHWTVNACGVGVQLVNKATGKLLGVPAARFGAVVMTLPSGTGKTIWTAVPSGDGVILQLAGHDLRIEVEEPLMNPPQFLIATTVQEGASCGTCWGVQPVALRV
ncbi:hypothetical protein SMD44_06912 [Streptomyces alboflavus]|uniref:Uncharacterized protein n=2 Tax=Streptomyces TaxID=1883 RepID=A0A1Z1WLX2_9ACTN|nr:hypothetical protein SMD44_06912 [Streptomyces alboflavus]